MLVLYEMSVMYCNYGSVSHRLSVFCALGPYAMLLVTVYVPNVLSVTSLGSKVSPIICLQIATTCNKIGEPSLKNEYAKLHQCSTRCMRSQLRSQRAKNRLVHEFGPVRGTSKNIRRLQNSRQQVLVNLKESKC